jgi:methyltransferase (TIGR00027 family)
MKSEKEFLRMNETNQKAFSARDFMAAAVFFLILIPLLPVFLLGYVLWVARFAAGRKSSASATAQAPLFARWVQHHLGARRDDAASRLWRVAPGAPPLAWRLVAGPLLLAHRVTGYILKTFRYPFEGEITIQNQGAARQTFYDRMVQQYLPEMAQFVILGAGFDTRAFNLPKDAKVRSFEIDTPATVAVKREMLAKAGIDAAGVGLTAADFEREDWLAKLIEVGFDPSQPALFIWEGVTMYLDRAAVEDTLRKIASTAKGSVVAFDYFTTEVLESDALMMRSIRASLSAGGEPLKFGVDRTPPSRERLAELLQACGLTIIEQRTLGQETEGKRLGRLRGCSREVSGKTGLRK